MDNINLFVKYYCLHHPCPWIDNGKCVILTDDSFSVESPFLLGHPICSEQTCPPSYRTLNYMEGIELQDHTKYLYTYRSPITIIID